MLKGVKDVRRCQHFIIRAALCKYAVSCRLPLTVRTVCDFLHYGWSPGMSPSSVPQHVDRSTGKSRTRFFTTSKGSGASRIPSRAPSIPVRPFPAFVQLFWVADLISVFKAFFSRQPVTNAVPPRNLSVCLVFVLLSSSEPQLSCSFCILPSMITTLKSFPVHNFSFSATFYAAVQEYLCAASAVPVVCLL